MTAPSVRFASPLGVGGSGLGTLFQDVPDEQAQLMLAAAYDAGIRTFDTAPLYGHGLSELRLGRFLRSVPRSSFTVSTKVGRYLTPPLGRAVDHGAWANPLPLLPVFDYSYDGTMRAFEQSASRLGFSDFDILYIHDVDRFTHGDRFEPMFDQAMDGCYRALEELRAGGYIRAIGVGVNESDIAARFLRAGRFDVVMIAGRYTLLDQSALTELLPLAVTQGVGVVAVGVFNSGILAAPAAHVAGSTYDYAPASSAIAERVRRLHDICAGHGVPVPAVALQFPFGHPAVVSVITGMSEPEHVARTLEWSRWPVPSALWRDLKTAGWLAQNTPTPAGRT